jgi:hypothetical protein
MAPQRSDTCAADYAILSQYDRYRAERDRFPAEYNAYVRLIDGGEILATFEHAPGMADGPTIRIVRLKRGTQDGNRPTISAAQDPAKVR